MITDDSGQLAAELIMASRLRPRVFSASCAVSDSGFRKPGNALQSLIFFQQTYIGVIRCSAKMTKAASAFEGLTVQWG